MNWKKLTSDLIAAGLTQAEIAKAIGCGQTTVSELQTGKTDNPRSNIGLALIALARSKGLDVEVPVFEAGPDSLRDRTPDAPVGA